MTMCLENDFSNQRYLYFLDNITFYDTEQRRSNSLRIFSYRIGRIITPDSKIRDSRIYSETSYRVHITHICAISSDRLTPVPITVIKIYCPFSLLSLSDNRRIRRTRTSRNKVKTTVRDSREGNKSTVKDFGDRVFRTCTSPVEPRRGLGISRKSSGNDPVTRKQAWSPSSLRYMT